MRSEDDQDKRSESKANNWIWYAVLSSIVVLSIAMFVFNNAIYRLEYPELLRLIAVTQYAEPAARSDSTADAEVVVVDSPEKGNERSGSESDVGNAAPTSSAIDTNLGKIIVRRQAPVDSSDLSKRQVIELSAPSSIRIGDTIVTGELNRHVMASDGSTITDGRTAFRCNIQNSESLKEELRNALDASNIVYAMEVPSFLDHYGPVLMMVVAAFLLMMFAARRISGIGSPMSFGRSRGKLYAQDDIGVTFDDVAGVEEAVEEVREIVDFLKFPDKYQRLGGRIPKGVLLVGPPGTGKTLLAKAIAGEAGVPYFSLSGSDFVEMFVGVGAARVRDMFQQASAKAPCIIFIDELDALGKSRSGSQVGVHDEREQTLNALLVEMDGFDPNNGIIVIAATNRPETLDPALLRPGRFDRNVLVDRPDKAGREDILKVHVKNVKLAPDVSIKDIASMTSGFCGADLANLVNEAALLAARKERNQVSQAEFEEGVERVTAGLEKKRRVMHEDEKLRVAYHEAAHALIAYSLPNTDPVHKVSIIPRGLAALGYTMQRPTGDRYLMTQSELEAQMQTLLAGTLAEEIVFKDISTGAQNDLERASAIARSMVMEFGMSRLGRVNYRESGRSPFLGGGGGEGLVRDHSEQTAREIDEEVKRIITDMAQKTKQILLERRKALESVTHRLIEIEVMDSSELARLIDETMPIARVKPGTSDVRRNDEAAAAAKPQGDSNSPAADAVG